MLRGQLRDRSRFAHFITSITQKIEQSNLFFGCFLVTIYDIRCILVALVIYAILKALGFFNLWAFDDDAVLACACLSKHGC
jgi:hypothetical protein